MCERMFIWSFSFSGLKAGPAYCAWSGHFAACIPVLMRELRRPSHWSGSSFPASGETNTALYPLDKSKKACKRLLMRKWSDPAGQFSNLIDGGVEPVCGISRYDDVAAGKEGGAEVFEPSSNTDWRIEHDLQGVAALLDE